jgi:phosphoribosylanthranilate isomerase
MLAVGARSVAVKVCGVTTVDDALLAVELGARYLGLNFYPASPRHLAPDQALAIARAVRAATATAGVAAVELFGVFVDAEAAEIAETVAAVGLDGVQLHGDETPELWAAVRRRLDVAPSGPPLDLAAATVSSTASPRVSPPGSPTVSPVGAATDALSPPRLLRALRLGLAPGGAAAAGPVPGPARDSALDPALDPALEPALEPSLEAALHPALHPATGELARWEPEAWGYLVEARHQQLYGGSGVAWDYAALGGWRSVRPLFLAGGIGPDNAAAAIAACRPFALDVCSRVEAAPGRKDPARLRALFAAVAAANAGLSAPVGPEAVRA